MTIKNVTDTNFSEETSKGLVLVDFWAPWCGPCKMLAPVLDELDSRMGDEAKITKVNVDENPETAAKFGVMSIPTLLVIKDGSVVDTLVGVKPIDVLEGILRNHK
ncbi:thioredoxin [Bacillus thuringiensis]|uniref:thioredoxin n=1 Tax=Bacillus thuringiensis TaxID=1428 RepID=UPI0021D6923A|nr:thioredoxin [Bacillus thuringiensis]MCU7667103.1 thioredoxin [Bacillus thuringiensis]